MQEKNDEKFNEKIAGLDALCCDALNAIAGKRIGNKKRKSEDGCCRSGE
ncbi:MAG: hypothetical protein RR297_08235 [Clostridia bacterium]